MAIEGTCYLCHPGRCRSGPEVEVEAGADEVFVLVAQRLANRVIETRLRLGILTPTPDGDPGSFTGP